MTSDEKDSLGDVEDESIGFLDEIICIGNLRCKWSLNVSAPKFLACNQGG